MTERQSAVVRVFNYRVRTNVRLDPINPALQRGVRCNIFFVGALAN
jgi:hypothetical protein